MTVGSVVGSIVGSGERVGVSDVVADGVACLDGRLLIVGRRVGIDLIVVGIGVLVGVGGLVGLKVGVGVGSRDRIVTKELSKVDECLSAWAILILILSVPVEVLSLALAVAVAIFSAPIVNVSQFS